MTVESSISHCDLESACGGICECILAPVVESVSVLFFEIRFHFLNVRVYALENTLLYVFEISASCI